MSPFLDVLEIPCLKVRHFTVFDTIIIIIIIVVVVIIII